MTALEMLRAAAVRIDELAQAATPGPWLPEFGYKSSRVQAVFVMDPQYPDDPDESEGIGGFDLDGDNRWSVALGPQVAPALSAWLRAEADDKERHDACQHWPHSNLDYALAFARVLLGLAAPVPDNTTEETTDVRD